MNRKVEKFLFFVALFIIAFAIVSCVLAMISPYEFANENIRRYFWNIIRGGFTVAILMTLFIGFKIAGGSNSVSIIGSIVGTVFIALIFWLFTFFSKSHWFTEGKNYNSDYIVQNIYMKSSVFKDEEFVIETRRVIIKPFMRFWVLTISEVERERKREELIRNNNLVEKYDTIPVISEEEVQATFVKAEGTIINVAKIEDKYFEIKEEQYTLHFCDQNNKQITTLFWGARIYPMHLSKGDKILIYYDPDHPKQIVFECEMKNIKEQDTKWKEMINKKSD